MRYRCQTRSHLCDFIEDVDYDVVRRDDTNVVLAVIVIPPNLGVNNLRCTTCIKKKSKEH